jgi:hypothetical protein
MRRLNAPQADARTRTGDPFITSEDERHKVTVGAPCLLRLTAFHAASTVLEWHLVFPQSSLAGGHRRVARRGSRSAHR